ncbi:hypothetical protein P7C70_g4240, partial [Phenoliferia sp. Uapishka_3]
SLPVPPQVQPISSPVRFRRPGENRAANINALAASLARLPRPYLLMSTFGGKETKSPERARNALRTGETKVAPETLPLRMAPPPRSFSNPTLLGSASLFTRSPSKERLARPLVASATISSPRPMSSLGTNTATSVLTASADRLDVQAGLDIFGSSSPFSSSLSNINSPMPPPPPLPRPKPIATLSTTTNDFDVIPPSPEEPDCISSSSGRTPRRAAAKSANPLPRPTRKTLAAEAALKEAELCAALPDPVNIVAEEQPTFETVERDLPTFNPAPILTQEQWSQLTQRNTRKNKQHFNKLSVDEVTMDENRPPSPTSKIRRSVSGSSIEAKKEGRESRAKKRRSALRSSLGGEDGEEEKVASASEDLPAVPAGHFMAAGDEEEYSSPVRGGRAKGAKKSSIAGKKSRRVKWDKALVYEGPVEPHGEGAGILKSSRFSRHLTCRNTALSLIDAQEDDYAAMGVKRGHRRVIQRELATMRGVPLSSALNIGGGDSVHGEDDDGSGPESAAPTHHKQFALGGSSALRASAASGGASTIPPPASASEPSAKRRYRRHPKPDLTAPEKPPSAYVEFSNTVREELKGSGKSFTEIARLVGELWQAVDREEKEQLEHNAAQAKLRFLTLLADYKKTPQYAEYQAYLADFRRKHPVEGSGPTSTITGAESRRPGNTTSTSAPTPPTLSSRSSGEDSNTEAGVRYLDHNDEGSPRGGPSPAPGAEGALAAFRKRQYDGREGGSSGQPSPATQLSNPGGFDWNNGGGMGHGNGSGGLYTPRRLSSGQSSHQYPSGFPQSGDRDVIPLRHSATSSTAQRLATVTATSNLRSSGRSDPYDTSTPG